MRVLILGICLATIPIGGCEEDPKPATTTPVAQIVSTFDPDLRQQLLKRINRSGDINDPDVPRPLVYLEEFFEGNSDFGSIGYNLTDQPSPAEFYEFFKAIRDKPEVGDVLVEVKDLEDPEGWPATDTIWIIINATVADVARWLSQRFAADELIEGFHTTYPIEKYDLPAGMQAIGVWWD
jgi:hypothetical protein